MFSNSLFGGIAEYIELSLGIFLFLCFLAYAVRPPSAVKHWHHQFYGLELSPSDVYRTLFREIKALNIPDLKVFEASFFEHGIFSAKREYLTVEYKQYTLDICCAKFGPGYYMSWWLKPQKTMLLESVPILNTICGVNPKYPSYVQLDTATMFQASVHNTIMAVIDTISKAKGVRTLSEQERTPVSKI